METKHPLTGIELLKTLDKVLIREKSGSYVNNKYVVLTTEGEVFLYAKEDSGFLNNVLGGKSRSFEIDVYDTNDKEVIKIRRPYTVAQDKMDVSVCGQPAAVVRKEVTFFKPVLTINDANDRLVIRVKGPVSISSECNFELYSKDKQRIGDISARRRAPGRDRFAARFRADLDVRYKAAIISTCFLIVGKQAYGSPDGKTVAYRRLQHQKHRKRVADPISNPSRSSGHLTHQQEHNTA